MNLKDDLKTSAEWYSMPEYQHMTIVDPDGWDKRSEEAFYESWSNELITEEEFQRRLFNSTISLTGDPTEDD